MQTSVEPQTPQSRPSISLSDKERDPATGPIPIFDHHLRLLTDSYLNFFQERKKIEESYVDSLTKLHRKTRLIDASFDERGDSITVRSVWAEVRDSVEREAQTRQAFLTTLTVDVVNALTSLKETQERTRKRIKEDLKESSIAYSEYAEGTLPKLKRTYLRKCQDVEDHKAAAAAQPIAPNFVTSPQAENNQTQSKDIPAGPLKPVVTSPQPLRPLDRRPSGSGPSARNRSPSTNTAFSDLASHGKKQLNQLITFLDKGNSVKDTLSGRTDTSALRAVRSKREAEEADKEYRKGVHWLETLRLRRTKTLEAGYNSLELFVHESASTVKQVLEKYTDNMTATTTTQTHLSTRVHQLVDSISPLKDVQIVTQSIPRSLASAIPKPVLYWNYSVGECSDLIFGVSLVDYATARGLADGEVPKIIRICTKEVNSRGLDSEGIYRISGRHAVVQELQHKIERNETGFEFNPLTDDVFAVSSLLKLYLRELPEPVFRYPLQDRLQHTEDRAEHQSNNFVLLRSKMRRLPPVHQATLKAVVEHLAHIAARSEKNKMDVKNLAIAFGGVIFGEDELPKAGDLLSMQTWKDTLMEDLISHASTLFDDRGPGVTSPPLPPAPTGQQAPIFSYGSAHTKTASVPAQASEDFTPRLPSRPANSIHPSSRANPATPTRNNMDPPPPPLPSRPTQASTSKPPAAEKVIPRPLVTGKASLPEHALPPTPVDIDAMSPISPNISTLTSTQEAAKSAAAEEESREDATLIQGIPTLPPPSPTKSKIRTPKFAAPTLPPLPSSVLDSPTTDNINLTPETPSVPGGFPS